MGSAGTILVVDDDPMLWEAPRAALAARRFNLTHHDHHLSDVPGTSLLPAVHYFPLSEADVFMTWLGVEGAAVQPFLCSLGLQGRPELHPASIGKKGSVC